MQIKKKFSGGGGESHQQIRLQGGGAGLKKRSPDLRSPEVGITVYTRLFCKGV